MSVRKTWMVGLIVGFVACIAIPVYALSKCKACDKAAADIATKLDSAGVTLVKAIQTAEERTKGKALTAFTEMDGDKLVFAIYVVANGKVQLIEIDQAGKPGRTQDADDLPGVHDEATHKVEKDNRPPGG